MDFLTIGDIAKKLDAKAHKLYPELKDKDGEFYKKTDEYLEKLGTGKTDPNALITASMLAAEELGIEPVSTRATPDPKNTGKGNEGKPVESAEGEGKEMFKRTDTLATMLANEGVLDLNKDGVKDRIAENRERIEREES